MVWQVVVQVGEGDFVLCPDRLSNDNLVDVIELIPVFIPEADTQWISFSTNHLRLHVCLWGFWGRGGVNKCIKSRMSLLEVDVPNQRLKLWSPRDGHVQSLGSEECLEVKQIEVVEIHQVREQLIGQAVQGGHHGQCELPATVGGAIHKPEEGT